MLHKTEVILVNEQDEAIGTMEKLEAHEKGLLHRAFSIFVVNDQQEILIHKRAEGKYHSAGLWTNTCCSHPSPGENILDAAHRRLQEEMGFDCPLELITSFIYKAPLENNLWEHELDHIIVGHYSHPPILNPEEASAFRWASLATLQEEIKQNPAVFTFWFKAILQDYSENLINAFNHESL